MYYEMLLSNDRSYVYEDKNFQVIGSISHIFFSYLLEYLRQ